MKNIKLIASIIKIKKLNGIKPGKNLSDFNWDSMAMISLISIFDEKFKKKINPDKIRNLRTIGDLDKFITQNSK